MGDSWVARLLSGLAGPVLQRWAGFAFPGPLKLQCLLTVIRQGSGFDFCTLQQSQPRMYIAPELASVSAEASGLQQTIADGFKDWNASGHVSPLGWHLLSAPAVASHAKPCFSKEEIGAGKGLGLG